MTPHHLLIVEDNASSREGLLTLLRSEGYRVGTACNGQEALDYLGAKGPPDLIILDMMMPVLDGWHFLKAILTLQISPMPAILVTTANPSIGLEWARAHGCSGLMRKPLDAEVVSQEVRRCLAV